MARNPTSNPIANRASNQAANRAANPAGSSGFLGFSPAVAGAGLMIAAGAVFAGVNTLVQYGGMSLGIASTRLAFWQYAIAFLFALPWVLRNGLAPFRTSVGTLHVVRVLLAVGGVQLWVAGLAHVPIWQAIALIMLSPFFVTLGAAVFLNETATPQRLAAVLVGFVGGMIVLAPWSDAFSTFALYPVGAAALWAFSSLLTKRMTSTESADTLTVYLLMLLTPLNAMLAWGEGIGIDVGGAGLLLVAVGFLTALAQWFLARAYTVADATYLQPFDHVKLPFNVILGVVVFGFAPPGSMWVGSLLIVGASFALLHSESRAASRKVAGQDGAGQDGAGRDGQDEATATA